MLSEELKSKLALQVQTWGEDGKVADTVMQHVLNIALAEPQNEHDVRAYCENNMLSTALVEWYNKFLDYLADHADEGKAAPAFPTDVLETARRFRDALNMFLEQYDAN